MSYLGNNNLPWDISRSSPIPTDAERFSGNSSTTAFTLTRSVNFPTDLEVFVENIQQEPITAYSVNGNSVLFTEAPPTGTNNVYVVYRNYQSGAQVSLPDGSITYSKLANNIRVFTTDNFTANGNVSSYGLTEPPADANTVFVTVDGVVQRAPAHYTTSGTTITFTSAPPLNANVHIRHLGFRTTSTVTALPANSNISQPILQGTTTANGNFLVTNGSVGIGTTSPGANLEVKGASNQNIYVSYTGGSQLRLKSDSDNSGVGTTGSTPLLFLINNGEVGQFDTSSNFKFNSGYGSVATAYGCRAWVSFNGTGTVAILASGNVSSITDIAVGKYLVNFTTAMPDANYSSQANCAKNDSTNDGQIRAQVGGASTSLQTSSSCSYISIQNTTLFDTSLNMAAFFR